MMDLKFVVVMLGNFDGKSWVEIFSCLEICLMFMILFL